MAAFASAVALTPIALIPGDIISISGALTAADGTNGNRFIVNPRTIMRVKNASGAPITVTVHTNYLVGGLALANDTFVVPATTGDVLFKFGDPLAIYVYDAATGQAWVEFSAVTTVTVAVYQD